MKPKQVDIQRVEPKNAALRPVYERIKQAQALEKTWLPPVDAQPARRSDRTGRRKLLRKN